MSKSLLQLCCPLIEVRPLLWWPIWWSTLFFVELITRMSPPLILLLVVMLALLESRKSFCIKILPWRTSRARTPVLSLGLPRAVWGHSGLAWGWDRFRDAGRTCRSSGGRRRSSGGWRHGWRVGLLHLIRQSCTTEIAKNCDFVFIWFYCFQLLFHYDKTELDFIAFSCYFIMIKLSLILLLLVIFCFVLTNFTISSILSYVLCNGLFEMPKNKESCVFALYAFISVW